MYFLFDFCVFVIMVVVAQLVRAPGCGPGGCGFKSHLPPQTVGFITRHTEQ